MVHQTLIPKIMKKISDQIIKFILEREKIFKEDQTNFNLHKKQSLRFMSTIGSHFHIFIENILALSNSKFLTIKDYQYLHDSIQFLYNTWIDKDFRANYQNKAILELMTSACLSSILSYNFSKVFIEYLEKTDNVHNIIINLLKLTEEI